MIKLLTGENDFELTKKIAQLKNGFDGAAERYDGAELTNEKLADVFAGQTLFAIKRLVIIDTPSASADLWQRLEEWANRLSDDTQLVLVESKPDKRTVTYKWLKKHATVQEFLPLGDRDQTTAMKWLEGYANECKVKLTQQQLRRMVQRAGNDQWELAHAVDKLALVDTITDEWIDTVIEQSPNESVFALFDTALNGDVTGIQSMLENLRRTEDAYRLFGLITSQTLQLTTLVYGQGDVGKVTSDTRARSSYPLQKLAPHAARTDRAQVKAMVKAVANADVRLKSSDADPWLVLISTLAEVASLR